MKVNLKSIKTQLIIFLCAFAFYLSFKDKDGIFLLMTLIAVISAIGFESVILFFRKKEIRVTDSSIISGLIIGFVLSSQNPWWIFLLSSFFAISSKHLIHFHNKHLFNPAAFGIFLTVIFFGASSYWHGAYLWYILVPFGVYFIYKIRKLELLIGYALTALGLLYLQATIEKIHLLNIFGYLSYFYIFIMMIEPKTTPVVPLGKFIFGVGVAALIFIQIHARLGFDAELFSLLVMNLFTPLLNKIPPKR